MHRVSSVTEKKTQLHGTNLVSNVLRDLEIELASIGFDEFVLILFVFALGL